MEVDPDIESSGLLDGLEGEERAERAELVAWLLDKGFTVEEIRGAFSPMLLASRRLIGDDGTYVSTRDIAEQAGMDIDMVQRVQRAIGLPTVDDPDEAVYLRADGEAVLHTAKFLELGFDADQLLQVTRTLAEGLSNAAEMMRYTALATVLQPGATELETAKGSELVVAAVAPLLGPMIEDMLMLQLRHAMETEAVNASERAAGAPLPGAREIAVAFADLVGFTRLGEERRTGGAGAAGAPAGRPGPRRRRAAGAVRQDDRRRGDAGVPRPGSAARRDARAGRRRRGRRELSAAAGRHGVRGGGQPRR